MTGWHGRLGGRVVSREDGLLLHLGLRALGPWGPPSTLGWLQGAVALRAPPKFLGGQGFRNPTVGEVFEARKALLGENEPAH
jgi:hypothetical protein